MRRMYGVIGLAAASLTACGDSTGPSNGEVAVRFASVRGGPVAAQADGAMDLTLQGTNGTLVLTDVWFIVSEFELEGDDDACPRDRDNCNEFEEGPVFLQLPMNGQETRGVRFRPPPGTYDELEFEIERLDVDSGRERALLAEIRQRFPDWPRRASVLVVGTFTPANGQPRPFRTFIDAEIEIEMDLVPPVVITADDGAEFTVDVDPRLWFARSGRVVDLSAFDWAATGRLLQMEFELELGFKRVRHRD